jgi:beta-lactamase regulating signal transducer with metallopeptidase domain
MATLLDFFSSASHQALQMVLNGAWLGLGLTAAVWLLMKFARRIPAAGCYLVWWTTLVIVLALPFLMLIPTDTWFVVEADAPQIATRITPFQESVPAEVVQTEPARPMSAQLFESPARPPEPTLPPPPPSSPGPERSPVLLGALPVALAALWFTVVTVLGYRLVRASRGLTRLKAGSEPLDMSPFPDLTAAIAGSGRRQIKVGVSDAISTPIAAGFFRPMIILPRPVAEQLSDADLNVIIRHELTHINRRDDWTKLAQKLIEAVFFFNPAVHLIGRQLELERELACDEAVVAQTSSVDSYARCLTRLAQLTNGGVTSLIPGALTGRKQIFRRFERLLLQLPAKDTRRRYSFRLTGIIVTVAVTGLLAAQLAPAITLPFPAVTLNEIVSVTTDDDDDDVSSTAWSAPETGATSKTVGSASINSKENVHGTTYRNEGGERTTSYISDSLAVSARVIGDLMLIDNNRDVAFLSPNGRFDLEVETDNLMSQVTVERTGKRQIEYTLYRGGKVVPFDKEARQWFGDRLAAFVEATGFNASARLQKIVDGGGVDAALQFIEDDVPASARHHYYEALHGLDRLTAAERTEVKAKAIEVTGAFCGRDDDADYESRYSVSAAEAASAHAAANAAARAASSVSVSAAYAPSVESRSRSSARAVASALGNEAASWQVSTYDDDDSRGSYTRINRRSSRYSRDTVAGDWRIRARRNDGRLDIKMETFEGDYQLGFTVKMADLVGLTQNDFTGDYHPVRFEYVLDPGTVVFEGEVGNNRGDGEFQFVPNPEFVEDLKARGIRADKVDAEGLFALAIHDVSIDYIDKMAALGMDNLTLDDLVSLSIHDVSPTYLADFQALGLTDLTVDDLIQFSIHDVEPDFVKECGELGYSGMTPEVLVQLSIHDVDIPFIQEMKELGLKDLPFDELVQFSIHDVDPAFVRDCQEIGFRNITPDELVQLSIHDVDISFVEELHELGLDDIDLDELVQFAIHDVDPNFIRACGELGYPDLRADELIQMSIHDIDVRFVEELIELGLNNIPVDELIQLKIHNVSPRFIKSFKELGYDRLDTDELIQFGIHDVTPRFVRLLAELGYDRVAPEDLIRMKIHDVTPSYIRRLKARGYPDLSIDDLIDFRLYGIN